VTSLLNVQHVRGSTSWPSVSIIYFGEAFYAYLWYGTWWLYFGTSKSCLKCRF